jgi:hypothetical protein
LCSFCILYLWIFTIHSLVQKPLLFRGGVSSLFPGF